jgi:2-hydroxy-6-oxonona-2,4-dienedioate hydrolase
MRVRTKILVASLAIIAGAGALVYTGYARDMTAARARLAGRSTTIPTTLGTLEYAEAGRGEPVLVIHGAEGGFDQGLDTAASLASNGYRLIAPSRFGYLRSAMPGIPSTAAQADAYVELLDKLDIDKTVMVGISAGAWSALQFAIHHPERCRALILMAPAGYLPKGTTNRGGVVVRAMVESDFVAWSLLRLTKSSPGTMSQMMLGTDSALLLAAKPGERARVNRLLEHLLPVSARIAGMQFDLKTAATPEPFPLEKISCPVLAISADDDRFGTAVRARAIAAGVPDGRAIIYPTGGHALVGRYDDAMRETAVFLRDLPAPELSR